ncbi:MAG: hypothetical protein KC636_15920, partial [Myxococcales bacterium]|nr:hypothetical protein [Myxococcales bacterium]
MSEETKYTANAGYALGRLERALAVAAASDDPALRERAEARADAWRAVLAGMADGSLTIGARTPVADTPAWVTLEVVHGGFATGRYLAEGPLVEHEAQLLAQLPADAPGESPRERLNLWYLGDVGHEALTSAVAQRRLDVTLPEEGALPVVAWLIEHGHEGAALELIAALRPLMHRLRFYPRLVSIPRPGGASVRLSTVSAVAEALRARRPNPRVVAMNATLQRWNPLYDRLVALWLETVEGEAPHLALDARGQLARQRSGQPIVAGGWPCRRWPADWGSRRDRWLADAREARGSSRHDHPKSNFACLQAALERCPKDSAALPGRDVAAIRRALAKSIAHHGAPGSPRREALRAEQAAIAARPLHVELAAVLLA